MDTELTTLRYYTCWRCRKTFLDGQTIGGRCPVNHTPGECCHFAETEVTTRHYEYAGAWVSNNA